MVKKAPHANHLLQDKELSDQLTSLSEEIEEQLHKFGKAAIVVKINHFFNMLKQFLGPESKEWAQYKAICNSAMDEDRKPSKKKPANEDE